MNLNDVKTENLNATLMDVLCQILEKVPKGINVLKILRDISKCLEICMLHHPVFSFMERKFLLSCVAQRSLHLFIILLKIFDDMTK